MNEPLLTVVIPVYNAEAYVRRAAASVLNQPCADRLELILVDDGSTDGSGALCEQIAAESSSAAAVRVIHQKNGGVSSARNLGIQESRGAYLAFLDADDWWIDSFFDAEAVDLLGERFDVIQLSYLSVSPDLRWYLKYPVQDQEYRNLTPAVFKTCTTYCKLLLSTFLITLMDNLSCFFIKSPRTYVIVN